MQNLDENFHRQNQEKKNQNQFLRQIPTEGGTPTGVVVVGGGGQSPKLVDKIQTFKLRNLGR